MQYHIDERPLGDPRRLRVVCIGAGAAGLNLAYQIDKQLKNVDLQIPHGRLGLGAGAGGVKHAKPVKHAKR